MVEVSIRDLRHHGGKVVDRVARGEQVIITRAGQPVAVLKQRSPDALNVDELRARWRRLPYLDHSALRADVDAAMDARI